MDEKSSVLNTPEAMTKLPFFLCQGDLHPFFHGPGAGHNVHPQLPSSFGAQLPITDIHPPKKVTHPPKAVRKDSQLLNVEEFYHLPYKGVSPPAPPLMQQNKHGLRAPQPSLVHSTMNDNPIIPHSLDKLSPDGPEGHSDDDDHDLHFADDTNILPSQRKWIPLALHPPPRPRSSEMEHVQVPRDTTLMGRRKARIIGKGLALPPIRPQRVPSNDPSYVGDLTDSPLWDEDVFLHAPFTTGFCFQWKRNPELFTSFYTRLAGLDDDDDIDDDDMTDGRDGLEGVHQRADNQGVACLDSTQSLRDDSSTCFLTCQDSVDQQDMSIRAMDGDSSHRHHSSLGSIDQMFADRLPKIDVQFFGDSDSDDDDDDADHNHNKDLKKLIVSSDCSPRRFRKHAHPSHHSRSSYRNTTGHVPHSRKRSTKRKRGPRYQPLGTTKVGKHFKKILSYSPFIIPYGTDYDPNHEIATRTQYISRQYITLPVDATPINVFKTHSFGQRPLLPPFVPTPIVEDNEKYAHASLHLVRPSRKYFKFLQCTRPDIVAFRKRFYPRQSYAIDDSKNSSHHPFPSQYYRNGRLFEDPAAQRKAYQQLANTLVQPFRRGVHLTVQMALPGDQTTPQRHASVDNDQITNTNDEYMEDQALIEPRTSRGRKKSRFMLTRHPSKGGYYHEAIWNALARVRQGPYFTVERMLKRYQSHLNLPNLRGEDDAVRALLSYISPQARMVMKSLYNTAVTSRQLLSFFFALRLIPWFSIIIRRLYDLVQHSVVQFLHSTPTCYPTSEVARLQRVMLAAVFKIILDLAEQLHIRYKQLRARQARQLRQGLRMRAIQLQTEAMTQKIQTNDVTLQSSVHVDSPSHPSAQPRNVGTQPWTQIQSPPSSVSPSTALSAITIESLNKTHISVEPSTASMFRVTSQRHSSLYPPSIAAPIRFDCIEGLLSYYFQNVNPQLAYDIVFPSPSLTPLYTPVAVPGAAKEARHGSTILSPSKNIPRIPAKFNYNQFYSPEVRFSHAVRQHAGSRTAPTAGQPIGPSASKKSQHPSAEDRAARQLDQERFLNQQMVLAQQRISPGSKSTTSTSSSSASSTTTKAPAPASLHSVFRNPSILRTTMALATTLFSFQTIDDISTRLIDILKSRDMRDYTDFNMLWGRYLEELDNGGVFGSLFGSHRQPIAQQHHVEMDNNATHSPYASPLSLATSRRTFLQHFYSIHRRFMTDLDPVYISPSHITKSGTVVISSSFPDLTFINRRNQYPQPLQSAALFRRVREFASFKSFATAQGQDSQNGQELNASGKTPFESEIEAQRELSKFAYDQCLKKLDKINARPKPDAQGRDAPLIDEEYLMDVSQLALFVQQYAPCLDMMQRCYLLIDCKLLHVFLTVLTPKLPIKIQLDIIYAIIRLNRNSHGILNIRLHDHPELFKYIVNAMRLPVFSQAIEHAERHKRGHTPPSYHECTCPQRAEYDLFAPQFVEHEKTRPAVNQSNIHYAEKMICVSRQSILSHEIRKVTQLSALFPELPLVNPYSHRPTKVIPFTFSYFDDQFDINRRNEEPRDEGVGTKYHQSEDGTLHSSLSSDSSYDEDDEDDEDEDDVDEFDHHKGYLTTHEMLMAELYPGTTSMPDRRVRPAFDPSLAANIYRLRAMQPGPNTLSTPWLRALKKARAEKRPFSLYRSRCYRDPPHYSPFQQYYSSQFRPGYDHPIYDLNGRPPPRGMHYLEDVYPFSTHVVLSKLGIGPREPPESYLTEDTNKTTNDRQSFFSYRFPPVPRRLRYTTNDGNSIRVKIATREQNPHGAFFDFPSLLIDPSRARQDALLHRKLLVDPKTQCCAVHLLSPVVLMQHHWLLYALYSLLNWTVFDHNDTDLLYRGGVLGMASMHVHYENAALQTYHHQTTISCEPVEWVLPNTHHDYCPPYLLQGRKLTKPSVQSPSPTAALPSGQRRSAAVGKAQRFFRRVTTDTVTIQREENYLPSISIPVFQLMTQLFNVRASTISDPNLFYTTPASYDHYAKELYKVHIKAMKNSERKRRLQATAHRHAYSPHGRMGEGDSYQFTTSSDGYYDSYAQTQSLHTSDIDSSFYSVESPQYHDSTLDSTSIHSQHRQQQQPPPSSQLQHPHEHFQSGVQQQQSVLNAPLIVTDPVHLYGPHMGAHARLQPGPQQHHATGTPITPGTPHGRSFMPASGLLLPTQLQTGTPSPSPSPLHSQFHHLYAPPTSTFLPQPGSRLQHTPGAAIPRQVPPHGPFFQAGAQANHATRLDVRGAILPQSQGNGNPTAVTPRGLTPNIQPNLQPNLNLNLQQNLQQNNPASVQPIQGAIRPAIPFPSSTLFGQHANPNGIAVPPPRTPIGVAAGRQPLLNQGTHALPPPFQLPQRRPVPVQHPAIPQPNPRSQLVQPAIQLPTTTTFAIPHHLQQRQLQPAMRDGNHLNGGGGPQYGPLPSPSPPPDAIESGMGAQSRNPSNQRESHVIDIMSDTDNHGDATQSHSSSRQHQYQTSGQLHELERQFIASTSPVHNSDPEERDVLMPLPDLRGGRGGHLHNTARGRRPNGQFPNHAVSSESLRRGGDSASPVAPSSSHSSTWSGASRALTDTILETRLNKWYNRTPGLGITPYESTADELELFCVSMLSSYILNPIIVAYCISSLSWSIRTIYGYSRLFHSAYNFDSLLDQIDCIYETEFRAIRKRAFGSKVPLPVLYTYSSLGHFIRVRRMTWEYLSDLCCGRIARQPHVHSRDYLQTAISSHLYRTRQSQQQQQQRQLAKQTTDSESEGTASTAHSTSPRQAAMHDDAGTPYPPGFQPMPMSTILSLLAEPALKPPKLPRDDQAGQRKPPQQRPIHGSATTAQPRHMRPGPPPPPPPA